MAFVALSRHWSNKKQRIARCSVNDCFTHVWSSNIRTLRSSEQLANLHAISEQVVFRGWISRERSIVLDHSMNFYFLLFRFRKSSCSDLQSRLKVRKVLGVGDTSGSICSSKISQILGQSDNLIFQLPQQLATWLLLTTILFSCLTMMVIILDR